MSPNAPFPTPDPSSSGPADRPARFVLRGPSRPLDPRTHAVRKDLADVRLAGSLFAPHYAEALPRMCTARAAMLRARPDSDAIAVSQLVQGEGFDVIDLSGGWAWGRCAADGYVGYVPADALGAVEQPTHRIVSPTALLFSAPDIKSPATDTLPFGARIGGTQDGAFLATAQGYVHSRHLTRIDNRASDPVEVAERLIGLPYLWGGRGADGIDCSGLVQVALAACGITAPRDSDQQREAVGTALPEGAALQRGDIVFFPGHVGFMVDGERLLHANAHWMTMLIEPLADVTARLSPDHPQPILTVRRP